MLQHVSCVQLSPGSTPPLLACLVGTALSDRMVLMTGLYAMTLSGGAAAAAALSVPVSDAAGGSWRTSLASWGLFALAAMLVWLPQLRRVHRAAAGKQRVSLWRNRTAWAITIFMAAHLPVGCAKRRPVAMGQMGSRRACAVTPSRYAPDAIVSEHAGMGCEGDQIGVVGVEVDLNQVAALPGRRVLRQAERGNRVGAALVLRRDPSQAGRRLQ